MSKTISVIGLGLIGGSMALDLKKSGFASKIIGVDKSKFHEKQAMELSIVNTIMPIEEAIRASDLTILSTPVDASMKLLPHILDILPSNSVLMDVGSTKSSLIEKVKDHPNRKFYVPSHPMAGTEYSGPSAAFHGLFKDRAAIICNSEDSFPKAVHLVSEVYDHLGSRLILMDAEAHDEHVGYVSHLSHAISYALAVSVLEKEKDDAAIFNLASGGFASTVRLAKSSVDMWLPIFEQNSKYILPILDTYLDKLTEFKSYLERGEMEHLYEFIKEANRINDKLEKK
ncbi:prephenate dehydrogenase [Apibacter mensalis]|jgi:prephenate dehydrogenase|uniref:Prephenate dehydrogenase n=1 Tax=Apibacter mensalis TaxID=1586267 RepID=A0A0X3AMI0_9FLAO|nr:prephenate dehydrogenase [Apibacter mensalis]CVK15337.1 prephenate dehydrogenase [Apibacter mensalis]